MIWWSPSLLGLLCSYIAEVKQTAKMTWVTLMTMKDKVKHPVIILRNERMLKFFISWCLRCHSIGSQNSITCSSWTLKPGFMLLQCRSHAIDPTLSSSVRSSAWREPVALQYTVQPLGAYGWDFGYFPMSMDWFGNLLHRISDWIQKEVLSGPIAFLDIHITMHSKEFLEAYVRQLRCVAVTQKRKPGFHPVITFDLCKRTAKV